MHFFQPFYFTSAMFHYFFHQKVLKHIFHFHYFIITVFNQQKNKAKQKEKVGFRMKEKFCFGFNNS